MRPASWPNPSTWMIYCGLSANCSRCLRKDQDRSTYLGPVPGELGFVVGDPQAAVRTGVAPVAAPVVVVNAGSVGREVLREQDVLQVVPARRVARDRRIYALAGHGLVRDSPQDAVEARRGRPTDRALERQR